MITALTIYDKHNGNFETTISVLDIIITYLIQNKTRIAINWNDDGSDGLSELEKTLAELKTIKEQLLSGTALTNTQYQEIEYPLYKLNPDRDGGLVSYEIEKTIKRIGLFSGIKTVINGDGEIFSNEVVASLSGGQMAEIIWWVKAPAMRHAFLIGRFASGEWYLHDQGYSPPKIFISDSRLGLETKVRDACGTNEYWLDLNSKEYLPGTFAVLLNDSSGPKEKHGELIPPGTYLAEIDNSTFRGGDSINCLNFLDMAYDIMSAYEIAGNSGKPSTGRLIIEMPKGSFLIYETDKISTHNLSADSIDPSGGGLLTRKTFYNAELILTDGTTSKIISVYQL